MKNKKVFLELHLMDGPSITWSIKGHAHVNSALEYIFMTLVNFEFDTTDIHV